MRRDPKPGLSEAKPRVTHVATDVCHGEFTRGGAAALNGRIG